MSINYHVRSPCCITMHLPNNISERYYITSSSVDITVEDCYNDIYYGAHRFTLDCPVLYINAGITDLLQIKNLECVNDISIVFEDNRKTYTIVLYNCKHFSYVNKRLDTIGDGLPDVRYSRLVFDTMDVQKKISLRKEK